MRGSDIETTPVFFSYVILTPTEIYLYLLKYDRVTARIENHFTQENINVIIREYNSTLSGISNVVGLETILLIIKPKFSQLLSIWLSVGELLRYVEIFYGTETIYA